MSSEDKSVVVVDHAVRDEVFVSVDGCRQGRRVQRNRQRQLCVEREKEKTYVFAAEFAQERFRESRMSPFPGSIFKAP